MVPGAFERQSTVSKRIPHEQQRSARSDDEESRKLRTGGCRERVSERWSESHCEVRGRRQEVIKGAFGPEKTGDMRMRKERRPTVASSK